MAAAYDREGRIWLALRGGWSVIRLDPSGEIVERIPLPFPDPSGLCFGGPGGDELFVTAAPGEPAPAGNVLRFRE